MADACAPGVSSLVAGCYEGILTTVIWNIHKNYGFHDLVNIW